MRSAAETMQAGKIAAKWIAVVATFAAVVNKVWACPANSELPSLRFNAETDRLYLEGSGCITPSDIFASKNATPDLPIKALTEDGDESDVETG